MFNIIIFLIWQCFQYTLVLCQDGFFLDFNITIYLTTDISTPKAGEGVVLLEEPKMTCSNTCTDPVENDSGIPKDAMTFQCLICPFGPCLNELVAKTMIFTPYSVNLPFPANYRVRPSKRKPELSCTMSCTERENKTFQVQMNNTCFPCDVGICDRLANIQFSLSLKMNISVEVSPEHTPDGVPYVYYIICDLVCTNKVDQESSFQDDGNPNRFLVAAERRKTTAMENWSTSKAPADITTTLSPTYTQIEYTFSLPPGEETDSNAGEHYPTVVPSSQDLVPSNTLSPSRNGESSSTHQTEFNSSTTLGIQSNCSESYTNMGYKKCVKENSGSSFKDNVSDIRKSSIEPESRFSSPDMPETELNTTETPRTEHTEAYIATTIISRQSIENRLSVYDLYSHRVFNSTRKRNSGQKHENGTNDVNGPTSENGTNNVNGTTSENGTNNVNGNTFRRDEIIVESVYDELVGDSKIEDWIAKDRRQLSVDHPGNSSIDSKKTYNDTYGISKERRLNKTDFNGSYQNSEQSSLSNTSRASDFNYPISDEEDRTP